MKINEIKEEVKPIKVKDVKKAELYHSGYSFKKDFKQGKNNEDQGFDQLLQNEIEKLKVRKR